MRNDEMKTRSVLVGAALMLGALVALPGDSSAQGGIGGGPPAAKIGQGPGGDPVKSPPGNSGVGPVSQGDGLPPAARRLTPFKP